MPVGCRFAIKSAPPTSACCMMSHSWWRNPAWCSGSRSDRFFFLAPMVGCPPLHVCLEFRNNKRVYRAEYFCRQEVTKFCIFIHRPTLSVCAWTCWNGSLWWERKTKIGYVGPFQHLWILIVFIACMTLMVITCSSEDVYLGALEWIFKWSTHWRYLFRGAGMDF